MGNTSFKTPLLSECVTKDLYKVSARPEHISLSLHIFLSASSCISINPFFCKSTKILLHKETVIHIIYITATYALE